MESIQNPIIRKAAWVRGKRLAFRNADTSDAAFIYSLRTDPELSKYLSTVAPSLDAQVEWLEAYRLASNQAYFIIETDAGEKIGTLRFYDPRESTVTWGSWIIKKGFPASYALESAFMVWHYAFYALYFDSCHINVRKGNRSVWKFNEGFGAQRIGETDQDFLYTLRKQDIEPVLLKYQKYLPNSIEVQFHADPGASSVTGGSIRSRFPVPGI